MAHFRLTLYQGPGNFGRDIVVTATTRSNGKVGVPGLIISDAELDPASFRKDYPGSSWYHAHKPGTDALRAACGGCSLGAAGNCYVQSNPQNASQPAAALRDEESKPMVERALRLHRTIRSAIAGDMAAVPCDVFEGLLYDLERMAGGGIRWLGYTHHPGVAPWLINSHVASCSSLEERDFWRREGWRTFTTLAPEPELHIPADSFLCPASGEAANVRGRRMTCAECKACAGRDFIDAAKPDGVIVRHAVRDTGHRAKMRVYKSGRLVGCGNKAKEAP